MTGHPLLFDLGPLSCGCTDHLLNTLYKSVADPPDSEALWLAHHDPYVREQLESVTERGLALLARIQSALLALVGGDASQFDALSKGALKKALDWARLSSDQLAEIRAQLAAKPPEHYSLEDWMLAVDYIVSRYLPEGVIRTEAEYLAVRAQILGKMQADTPPETSEERVLEMARRVPLVAPFKFSHREQAVLDFAKARAGELIRDLGERARHRVNQVIVQHESLRLMNDPEVSMWSLQSKLQDEFAVLNRDWRRVAVTEVARDTNEGFIAALAPGTKVKRVEAYAGACSFCRKINGMVFSVKDPGDPDKQAWRDVWVGKSNVDRSASPRKRVGDELIERTPAQMWWPAAGTQHPNCRGGWAIVTERPKNVDPEFADWLDATLSQT